MGGGNSCTSPESLATLSLSFVRSLRRSAGVGLLLCMLTLPPLLCSCQKESDTEALSTRAASDSISSLNLSIKADPTWADTLDVTWDDSGSIVVGEEYNENDVSY